MPAQAMEFFDCNCVLGEPPEGSARPAGVEGLIGLMDRYGISRALVYHRLGELCDIDAGNEKTRRDVDRFPGRLVPCYVAAPDPFDPECSKLRSVLDRVPCAVRLAPKSLRYSLEDWQSGRLLSLLAQHRVPVFMGLEQLAVGDMHQMDALHRACTSYPSLHVVLTGMDNLATRSLLQLMAIHPNLHIEISTLYWCGAVEAVTQSIGSDRLLFGSGMPCLDPGGAMAVVELADIPQADKQAIAGGNLAALLSGSFSRPGVTQG